MSEKENKVPRLNRKFIDKVRDQMTENELQHPNFKRGLSTPEEKQLTLETIRKHQQQFKPKPQSIAVDKDGRPITNNCCWQGKHLPPISDQH